ncbi:MAG: hypothetical protein U9R60_18345 [Bacteroidota bacterium]|nr:hypothetical protein [Bacteroidota bacterium]
MKKFTLIITGIIFICSSYQLSGQDMQYLFQKNDGKLKVSGFGGIPVEFSSVMNNFAVSVGGGGAVIFNQAFYIGGYGMGLSTDHRMTLERYSTTLEENISYNNRRVNFGHGGFWIGYLHQSYKTIHFNVSAKLGWGEVSLFETTTYRGYDEHFAGDNCFVFIPQIEAELNLLKWFKINFGLGYRIVSGLNRTYLYLPEGAIDPIEKQYYDNKDFNSVTGTVTLVFGWFAQ